MNKKKSILAISIIALIILIDQCIKIWVKTNMSLYESHEVTSWFYIYFIENNGMAFGMSFINKTLLSLFRLVAIIAIGYYLYLQIRKGARWRFVILLSMLLAGAAGNLIDCMFYGLCFSPSGPHYVSQCVPFGEGYSTFLNGKVVDMFYFPLIVTDLPAWLPFWGGERFIFFSPIFNFADASVSVSVILSFFLCRKELAEFAMSSSDEKHSNSDGEEPDDKGRASDTP